MYEIIPQSYQSSFLIWALRGSSHDRRAQLLRLCCLLSSASRCRGGRAPDPTKDCSLVEGVPLCEVLCCSTHACLPAFCGCGDAISRTSLKPRSGGAAVPRQPLHAAHVERAKVDAQRGALPVTMSGFQPRRSTPARPVVSTAPVSRAPARRFGLPSGHHPAPGSSEAQGC